MKKLKRITIISFFMLASLVFASGQEVSITTDNTKMTLWREGDGSLTTRGYGIKRDTLNAYGGRDELVQQFDFYPAFGGGYLSEPALQATHADGDVTTRLLVQNIKVETDKSDSNIITTEILMKDPAHEFYVTIFLRAYQQEDVIQIWTKIDNREDGGVTLHKFASAAPMNFSGGYWLTQFAGTYSEEGSMQEERLSRGMKVLYSNMGARAHRMRSPMFMVSLNGPLNEDSSYAIGSALMWPGSFNFSFDIESHGGLRMLVSGNGVGSLYYLEKGESLETPKSLWVFSTEGAGGISRRFHDWGRKYSIGSPQKPRPVLLNNWEATGMNFDENRLVGLFEDAKGVGFDVFLLDDGWFGNKYRRDSDTCGLGDWDVAVSKLPNGLGHLCKEAKKRGLGFGIWLEPEMVSPKSELFERHPDWALYAPNREPILGRNQLVLDLTNPQVRKFVWGIFEKTLSPNPIKYVKWDANCCIYQPVSHYETGKKAGNVDFDYNKYLLAIMEKFSSEFRDMGSMLCSGGGARVDYASLKNFYSFWPSDNTDPLSRVYIQWGFSQFYPSMAQSAHVTHMGGRPMKFCFDVAMSGALGFDIDISKVSPEEKEFFKSNIELYKKEIRPITAFGDMYRLKSPYQNSQSAIMFADKKKERGVLFVYQVRHGGDRLVRLNGLDPDREYMLKEVALRRGEKSALEADGKSFSGRALMQEGIQVPTENECDSAVILLRSK